MQQAFITAAKRQTHICLGLRLVPLQLGHIRALYRVDSPMIVGGAVTLDKLLHAVFLCAQPWRKSESDQDKWWIGWFMWFWSIRCCRMTLKAESDKFAAYWNSEMQVPETKGSGPRGEPIAPFWMTYLSSAMTDLGLSVDDALDMRFIELGSLLVISSIRAGRTDLWDESDEALWEAAQARN